MKSEDFRSALRFVVFECSKYFCKATHSASGFFVVTSSLHIDEVESEGTNSWCGFDGL